MTRSEKWFWDDGSAVIKSHMWATTFKIKSDRFQKMDIQNHCMSLRFFRHSMSVAQKQTAKADLIRSTVPSLIRSCVHPLPAGPSQSVALWTHNAVGKFKWTQDPKTQME
jgi:hypothetical protein